MKYTRNVFGSSGPASRTVTEAVDDEGRLKGQVFAQDSYMGGRGTRYPVHPSMRPAMKGALASMFDEYRPQASPTGSYSADAMNGVRGPEAGGDYRMDSYDEGWAQAQTKPGQTIPLFTHDSQKFPAKVDFLRTAEGSRALTGPLLGIANREAMNRGEALTPSEDLSRHSAPMVARMNKALGTQFADQKTNDLDFGSKWAGSSAEDSIGNPDPDATAISDDEVNKGRSNFRNLLKAGRPVRDAGYSQMGLFDAPE
jgi:hypothetical protein